MTRLGWTPIYEDGVLIAEVLKNDKDVYIKNQNGLVSRLSLDLHLWFEQVYLSRSDYEF